MRGRMADYGALSVDRFGARRLGSRRRRLEQQRLDARPCSFMIVSQFVLDQYALTGTFKVIKLTMRQRPHERRQAAQAQKQGDWYEQADPRHRAHRVSRKALATTMIDEVDIAIAAISGVTIPNTAKGTARIL